MHFEIIKNSELNKSGHTPKSQNIVKIQTIY